MNFLNVDMFWIIYNGLNRNSCLSLKRQQSSEYLGLLYHKRDNPPSFDGASSLSCNSGAGSANSRIMNMIISDVLLTGSQTCPGGVSPYTLSRPRNGSWLGALALLPVTESRE